MRKTIFLSCTLFLMACSSANVTTTPEPEGPLLWSNPKTWGGKVPAQGDTVTIPKDKTIVLDVSPPSLRGLEVDGTLSFDPKARLTLKTDYVMVHGTLQVGTEKEPVQGSAEIILTSNNLSDSIHNMGAKVLGVMGGTLELQGAVPTRTWTRLNGNVTAGSTTITVQDPINWKVGDEIIITSSSFYNPYSPKSQTERRQIKKIEGQTLTLSMPLSYAHWGTDASGVNQRAEVGLLSRNVVVRSDESILDSGTEAGNKQMGGHLMAMSGSKVHINGAEFRDMGQRNVFGRYPVHFHQLSDGGLGSYVKNSSIWRSYNRCLTIHGTNKLNVENNVMYNSLGHCVYFEEGTETGNTLKNNLVAQVKALRDNARLIPTDDRPAAYWITHPSNTLTGNVASEAHVGFWYALPEKPLPFGRSTQDVAWMDSIYPRRSALGGFDGNVAHSNWQGLFVDTSLTSTLCQDSASRNTCKDHSNLSSMGVGTSFYAPRATPSQNIDIDKKTNLPVPARFQNFLAYKHADQAVWFRGGYLELLNPTLTDNHIGAIFASSRAYLTGGTFIGKTENTLGDVPELEPRTGFQFYDGPVGIRNSTFKNYTGDRTAALGYLRHTSFNLSAQNYASGLKFENSKRVYLDTPPAPEFSNYEDPHDGYRGAVFYDQDGSVTGTANRHVTASTPFLTSDKCSFKAEWNAYTCDNTYMNLNIDVLDGTEVANTSSAYTVQRSDGKAIELWGVPNGNSKVQDGFETRLVATTGGNTPLYSYTLKSGTRNIPSKILVAATVDALPTDNGFVNIAAVPGTTGAWVKLTIPASGPVFVYRTWWFDENSGAGMLKVSNMLDILGENKGKAYYQDDAGVHVVLPITDPLKGRYVSVHVCKTKKCA
ncbi:G8 domain-containing protein [Deinococcus misasensis]|uniref:G8 domain-containing protein n=1 Tax=Deinococcus misasensis TaxID=392413 RepID=UPI0005521E2F|nr:G8 domain-containing protein [Deinococcus misasensis]